MKTWKIQHFDDYHSITQYEGEYKVIELGCFPVKENYGYDRYFGLFYKGKKPKFEDVFAAMKKKVKFNLPSINWPLTENDLSIEIKKAIK